MVAYKTLLKPCEALFIEKASKFYAFCFPMETEADFKHYLLQQQEKYPKAGHHCFAFRLVSGPSIERYSDDGEPSGTAGKPIYGQILSKDLYNVGVIVSRIFGGTKLGTGGLKRAYKAAAQEALDTGTYCTKEICFEILLKCPVASSFKVHEWANSLELIVLENRFEGVENYLGLQVPLSKKTDLDQLLNSFDTKEIKLVKTTLNQD